VYWRLHGRLIYLQFRLVVVDDNGDIGVYDLVTTVARIVLGLILIGVYWCSCGRIFGSGSTSKGKNCHWV